MSEIALVVDPGTGAIKRKLTGSPTQFALNVSAGESLFAVINDDGLFIDDAALIISETGEWEAAPGAPPETTLPGSTVELIAT